MKDLFAGVKKFSAEDFEKNKLLFQQLGKAQAPHTLFIGCSDSRVVPALITKTLPGELFVVRNIANVVPYYRSSNDYLATTSAIEYALEILRVDNIIVCGHSNCGGCQALFLEPQKLEQIPHTRKWLELIADVKTRAVELSRDENIHNIHWFVEQMNIVEQMNHLLTYPFIQERYRKGDLKIYGWYYEIASGVVYNYNRQNQEFEKIE